MATRDLKLRVELDGEKQYKQALSELNKGNQVLASEMRKLSAEYQGNEKSVEALTAKNELLQRQMLQQADKIRTLRDAVAHAAEKYGEADKRTQDWKVKLNDAEAAMIKMGRSMQENTAEIERQNSALAKSEQALETVDKESQVLASEMRKLAAEYEGNENSVEALTAKGEILEKQLTAQKTTVQTLREAVAAAAAEYGEADKRTQDWQIKLNDAEAAQYKLEHAIEENNAEIKKQDQAMVEEGKTVGKLGDQVQELAGKLGIRLPEGAKKALNGMQGFSAGTVAAMGAAAAAVAGLIKAVKALNDMTIEAAGRADTLLTESVKSGLSVAQLQAINYASPFIDVDTSTFTGTLERMPKLLSDAQEQWDKYAEAQRKAAEEGKESTATLGKQAQAFQELGVSVENSDGSLRDANETMWEALEALNQMGDTTEANALANDLFGKSYADLKPLIQNTAEAQRLMNEAVAEGYVLSEEQIKILGEVDDQVQKNQLTFEEWKNKIAVEFAPASGAAMKTFGDVAQKAGQSLVDTRLIEILGAVVQGIAGIVDAATNFAGKIPGWMNPIEQLSNTLRGLAVVAATVSDAMNVVSGIANPLNWGSGKARTALGWNIGNGQMSNLQQLKYGSGDYTFYNAAGTDNWRDTSRLEALMERNVQILEQISGEFSGLRVKGRLV